MKTTLIAARAMTYATRRLKAGDSFDVPANLARPLVVLGRASYPAAVTALAEVAPVPAATPPDDDLADLRTRYAEALGKRPFMGWDADTLREKIAAASQSDD